MNNNKEYCYICGEEIKEGEKVNWRTETGMLVVCRQCDFAIDVEEFIEEGGLYI
jgi:ribosome-binding protein aMBF1 (putative translation factor)